ncbi:hypothetical protein LY474_34915 [Myxococcus stipitatus]|uniref:hypothetical protein n=1 Tax=Myxococcus stipitatus TaxID=83455 RepID=UPI001F2728A4|nr:hypothetical protein [Myxococcus stipitatus]MCE9673013.1 hypothetical protein [Myxococcus stipitatus]
MSLPESVLPPLAADAVSSAAQALGELPVGPSYSAGYLKSVLDEKAPRTFGDLVQALKGSGSSTLALVATLYADAPATAVTLEGPFTVSTLTGHVGDLHVKGDLTAKATLVVVGNLTVDGVLTNDAESTVVVRGQVRCRAMDTSGWVTILGGLSVEHALHGLYNDDSVEVLGPITAGLIISNDHLIYGKPKMAERKPSQGAAWGPEVFDARWAAHKQELASLLVDGIVDADGEVDVAKLVAARPPWK